MVTGGAGFIGSNLCEKLVKDPNNFVMCLDNWYTGRFDNIKHLKDLPNFTVITKNIINPFEYSDLNVDEIYNAACPASPPAYQKDPIYTTLTCVVGMYNILELAQRSKAKVLQFSTSEVYGNPSVHPQSESYFGNVNTTGIRSCYDEGKRCAESLCFDYMREYDVDVRVARIFNTYGPKMDKNDGRVVSNFINQALSGNPITIYGTGDQTRSFCYVSDTVDALIRLMNLEINPKSPVNIGNPDEFTIMELAHLVQDKIGLTSTDYKPLPQDDPIVRRPDITKAKSLLDWEPKVHLLNGLDATINYFKEEK